MKHTFFSTLVAIALLTSSEVNFAQAPTLGTAANFVLFSTNGAVSNSGTLYLTKLTGNVGANIGAVSGFGNVDGQMHSGNAVTAQCASDLLLAYAELDAAIPDYFPGLLLGNGDTLPPGVYSVPGAATLDLDLTLDAQNDPNAVFIFQIEGALSTSAHSKVKLINGALACNVFWKVEGLMSMATGTTMRGTIVVNNAAISMSVLDTLEGRALSINGAVTVASTMAYTPIGCGSPALTGPMIPPLETTECYALLSGNGPVENAGITYATGDVGTNSGLTSGFNPLYISGTIHPIPDISTSQAASDLTNVYNVINAMPEDIILHHPTIFGHNLVLTPHTYLMNGAVSFTDTLYLNAQGNPDAVFVIQVEGAFSTTTGSKVNLINGAQAQNVFWLINGAVDINDYSVFNGSIIAYGGINVGTGVVVNGRVLTVVGALSTFSATINSPSGTSGPAGTIVGPSSVCQAQNGLIFSVPAIANATGYIWTIPADATITAGNNTDSITVEFSPSATTGNGIITVQGSSSCGVGTVSPDFIVTVNANPTGVIASASDSSITVGASIDLFAVSDAPDDYSWVSDPAGFSSLAQNPTNVSPTETTTYTVTVTNADGCKASDDVTVTVDACNGHWTGAVSSDWSDGENWCSGMVPGATDNAIIVVAANQPHITVAVPVSALCNNLTLETGTTLTVDAGKALTVNGDLSNEGTVVVKADATGLASLITEGAVTGSGTFQMEQHLTGSNTAGTPDGLFYYVSTPVVGATVATYGIASGNKVWSADETTQSYPQITNESTILNATQGYVVRMLATGTLTISGSSFNTGIQSASGLSRTGTSALNRGYNLLGNPYTSTVDWNTASKTNLETSIWFRTNNGTTMVYDTYNAVGDVGTNNNGNGDVSNFIPPTQAFWVRVNADGNTGQLDFDNADRSHGTWGTWGGIYKLEEQEGMVRMALSDGIISDEAIVMFNASAQDDFDDFDSRKFWSQAIPQLYMTEATDTIVINGLSSTITNPIVDLGVKLPAQGNYTLQANDITVVGESVILEDRMLNIFQDLNVDPSYNFTSTAGNIGDRFALHFGMIITGMEEGAALNSKVYGANQQLNIILADNMKNGKVQVLDMTGRVILTANLLSNRTMLDLNTAAGIYLIRIETMSGTDTHRISL
jgi:hypothetical protein